MYNDLGIMDVKGGKHMEKGLEQTLESFQIRKSKAEKFILLGGIAMVVAVLMFALFSEQGMVVPGIIIGVVAAVLLVMGLSGFSKVTHDFKHNFLVKMMGELIEDGVYEPKNGLSHHQVYATEFLKKADRFKTEDMIRGKIDGVSFISSDVKLEERRVRHTKNGTQTYYVTYFLGRIFVFEFNKEFDGYLQCLEQGRPTVNRRYDKIQLESIEFNKKFTTYATNPHSAFYVLTPHFMESMMKFERENPGKLGFSFLDTKLYVGINNNKDTFELTMFRKIDKQLIESFKKDIQVIYDLVDDLKLNNDIFKK